MAIKSYISLEETNSQLTDIAKRSSANKIVALGDSNTYAEGKTGWDTYLKWKLARDVVNLGISGNKTEDLVARTQAVLDLNPGMVIMLIGTNDIGNSVPVATSKTNIESLTSTFMQNGIIPVYIAIPPIDGASATVKQNIIIYNRMLQRHCIDNGLFFVDGYSIFLDASGDQDTSYFEDTLHLNSLGHKTLADSVISVIDFAISDIAAYWRGETQAFANPTYEGDTNADGLADNLTAMNSDGVVVVYSLVAHPTLGNYQQMAKEAQADDNKYCGFYGNLDFTKLTAGGYARVALDIDTDAIAGSCRIAPLIQWYDAGWGGIGGYNYLPQYYIKCAVSALHITEDILIPANAGNGILAVLVYGTAAATVRIGRTSVKDRV